MNNNLCKILQLHLKIGLLFFGLIDGNLYLVPSIDISLCCKKLIVYLPCKNVEYSDSLLLSNYKCTPD